MRNPPAGPDFPKPETVFVDRDGVINEKLREGEFVRTIEEFRVLPGVPEAIARLNREGMRVIVVTNQRGIALGLYSSEDVLEIHRRFQAHLQKYGAHVDGFYFCPHEKDECGCRKPMTGLFDQAIKDFPSIRADASLMIGDSLSDMEFGRAVGMPAIFIQGPRETQKPGSNCAPRLARQTCGSLAEAVESLLSERIYFQAQARIVADR